MHKAPALLAAAAILGSSIACLAADSLTIAEIAPKDSFLVAGVDDSKGMFEAFDRTGFKSIWDDPTFKKWFEKHSKEAMEDFAASLEPLGLTMDDLRRPTGPMGLAAWFTENKDEDSFESPPPAFVALANYDDLAQEMDEKILAAIEKAENKKVIESSDKDHDGVTIYSIRILEQEEEKPAGDEEEMEFDDMSSGPMYPEVHYARVEGALVLSSEISGIENAIDRLKGDKMPSVDDEADFNDARSRLGKPHAYAVALAAPITKMLKGDPAAIDEGGMGQMLSGMTGSLGLDDLRAASLGVQFDTESAMLEQSYSILASKKTGLVALFDAPAIPFDPPAFVGESAASVTLMQFNFPGVIPLANQVVAGLPEDMQAMAGQQIQAATMFLGPVLANLGPEVCIVGNLLRPLAVDSEQQVWAMKVRDANALQQSIAGVMPMTGFESRDFQGNQIWSPAAGGMVPADSIAIGLGFGWLFAGPTKGVEDLMRQAGAADNPKLADDKAFKQAASALDDKGIAYSYMKVGPSLDWAEWYSKNIDKILAAQAEEAFGTEPPADDEERQWREDAKKSMMDAVPSWMRDPPPMDVIRKHIGDSVLEFKSTPQGFEGRTMTLRGPG